MATEFESDLLFDDFSILKNLNGGNAVRLASPVSDCDCIGYNSTSNNDDINTDKITASVGQAN